MLLILKWQYILCSLLSILRLWGKKSRFCSAQIPRILSTHEQNILILPGYHSIIYGGKIKKNMTLLIYIPNFWSEQNSCVAWEWHQSQETWQSYSSNHHSDISVINNLGKTLAIYWRYKCSLSLFMLLILTK